MLDESKAQRNKTEYVEIVMGPKCSHGYISKRPFLPSKVTIPGQGYPFYTMLL